MKKRKCIVKIPYGEKHLIATIDSDRFLGVARKEFGVAGNAASMVRKAMSNSSMKAVLKSSLSDTKKALVCVTDITRNAHLSLVLRELLKQIKKYCQKVDIIVATGLHKKHDVKLLTDVVGKKIFKEYSVFSHDQEPSSLIKLGFTARRVPIVLNKAVRVYDAILTAGVIEPHLYAGYSGGAKTIAIGLAGEDTINATHGVRFLDDPHTKLGSIKENIFQQTLWEITGSLNTVFAVNVVNGPDGEMKAVFCGRPKDVFRKGVEYSERLLEIKVKDEADIVICGVGYPKDVNLYQASRAINYILNVDKPILKKGGVLIVVCELRDGIGEGLSEKRFYGELKRMSSPADFIARIKRSDCIAGIHRAYMVAKPLLDYQIVFVSKNRRSLMVGLPFAYFETIEQALDHAEKVTGRTSKIYIVPKALSIITGIL